MKNLRILTDNGVVPVLGETADDIAFTHYGTKILSTSSTHSLFKFNAHDAIRV